MFIFNVISQDVSNKHSVSNSGNKTNDLNQNISQLDGVFLSLSSAVFIKLSNRDFASLRSLSGSTLVIYYPLF